MEKIVRERLRVREGEVLERGGAGKERGRELERGSAGKERGRERVTATERGRE